MRIFKWFFTCLLFTICFSAQGQKFLQIEKNGSPKTVKIFIGETFQVKVNGQWYTRTINNILLDEGIIVVEDGVIALDEIESIRNTKGEATAKAVSSSLYVFGAGWVLFSLVDALAGGTLTFSVVVVAGTAFALGFAIRKLFGKRQYKIGKKFRLRLVDLNPLPTASLRSIKELPEHIYQPKDAQPITV